jgi:hypothetical protein
MHAPPSAMCRLVSSQSVVRHVHYRARQQAGKGDDVPLRRLTGETLVPKRRCGDDTLPVVVVSLSSCSTPLPANPLSPRLFTVPSCWRRRQKTGHLQQPPSATLTGKRGSPRSAMHEIVKGGGVRGRDHQHHQRPNLHGTLIRSYLHLLMLLLTFLLKLTT